MSKHSAFFRKVRKVCLCLLTLCLLQTAIQPRPANAAYYIAFVTNPGKTLEYIYEMIKEGIEWAQTNLEYGEYVDALITYYETMMSTFDSFMSTMSDTDASLILGQSVEARTNIVIHQAMADKAASATYLGSMTRLGLRSFSPKNEGLCKAVTALSSSVSIMGYVQEVSRTAAEAIHNRYQCPTCSGNGPDYTRHEMERRCQQGYGNPREKYAAACVGTMKGTDGRDGVDADMYASVDGGQVFTMPKVVSHAYIDPVTNQSVTVNTLEADAGDSSQKFWLSVWDHCFLVAGPRPTPPHGAAAKTPTGKAQRAMFNHCAASQNALIKQCTDWLAYYTRPNCSDSSALCAKQVPICKSAEDMINLDRFDNCTKGLSAYEQAWIAQNMCFTKAHAISQRTSGADDNGLKDGSDICIDSWSSWQEYLLQLKSNARAGAAGMGELKRCWAQVDAMGRAAAAEGEDAEVVASAMPPAQWALPAGSYIVPVKATERSARSAGEL